MIKPIFVDFVIKHRRYSFYLSSLAGKKICIDPGHRGTALDDGNKRCAGYFEEKCRRFPLVANLVANLQQDSRQIAKELRNARRKELERVKRRMGAGFKTSYKKDSPM